MNKAITTILGSTITFVAVLTLLIAFGNKAQPVTNQYAIAAEQESPVSPPISIKPPTHQAAQTLEPQWTNYPPIRNVVRRDLGNVLSDIESHMPIGHIYRDADKITWGHETSHGLASQIRMQYSGGIGLIDYINNKPYFRLDPGQSYVAGQVNGFYVLNNKAVIIIEPQTTLRAVTRNVPPSLRGMSYNLYMGAQLQSWDDCPLYLVDEWVAYTNGSTIRRELNIVNRGESVTQMLEMGAYVLAEAMTVKTDEPQFKNFVMWNLNRMMKVYKDNQVIGGVASADAYWIKVRTAPDAETLRQFTRSYYGAAWTSKVLGF